MKASQAKKRWVFFTNASPFDGTGTEPCQKQCSCNSGNMAAPRAERTQERRQSVKLQQCKDSLRVHNTKTITVHQGCICPGSLNNWAWPSPSVPAPPSFSPLPSLLAQEDGHSLLLPRQGQCLVSCPHLRTCSFLSPANCQNKSTEYAQISGKGNCNGISCHSPENGNWDEGSDNSSLLSATWWMKLARHRSQFIFLVITPVLASWKPN